MTLASMLCNELLGSSNLVLRSDQRFTQTFKLTMECVFCLSRIWRRDERPRLDVAATLELEDVALGAEHRAGPQPVHDR